MTVPVVLDAAARGDLLEAHAWYEQKQVVLGGRFVEEVERVFARIARTPTLYACIRRDVRRVTTKKFPYVVYYRLESACVEIIAVLHGSRKASTWKRRL